MTTRGLPVRDAAAAVFAASIACASMCAATRSSHGARSASVSGVPSAIFARASSECRSSASTNTAAEAKGEARPRSSTCRSRRRPSRRGRRVRRSHLHHAARWSARVVAAPPGARSSENRAYFGGFGRDRPRVAIFSEVRQRRGRGDEGAGWMPRPVAAASIPRGGSAPHAPRGVRHRDEAVDHLGVDRVASPGEHADPADRERLHHLRDVDALGHDRRRRPPCRPSSARSRPAPSAPATGWAMTSPIDDVRDSGSDEGVAVDGTETDERMSRLDAATSTP